MNAPLVLSLPGNDKLGEDLVATLPGERGRLTLRRFPDGESYVRVDSPVTGRELILACTLDRPDAKLLPLLFVAAAGRDLGAARIGLVAPYLAYMRQDHRFQPGEAITSSCFAAVLSHAVDWIVTVDPHLHRRSALSEIYSVPSRVVHAAPLVAAWIRQHVERPLLVGPDAESEQWVRAVSEAAGAAHIVLEKVRRGDRDVDVSVPQVDRWRGHTPVLVDDIISTGRTMIETVGHLRRAGMAAPVCVGVHAVFADGAYEALVSAGASLVVTSDTIPHVSNAFSVAELIGEGVRAVKSAAGVLTSEGRKS